MPHRSTVPEASLDRLALYNCYIGEMLRRGHEQERITSRELAEALQIKEETVRRDLSFLGSVGRPGSGYEMTSLFRALQTFLGLKDDHPILKVGTVEMLRALRVVFPPHAFGVQPVALYSELPDDVGTMVDDVEVRHISELPGLDPALDVSVALVACSPEWVEKTLDLLHQAGVTGVLLLTPVIRIDPPEGMTLTQMRMPCDLKSLACRCKALAERA